MITISTPNGTARKIRVVQIEAARNVTREIDFYNLYAMIAVGALIWCKLEKIISFALIDESFSPSVERNYMRIAFHH